jgi:hypothetical protein
MSSRSKALTKSKPTKIQPIPHKTTKNRKQEITNRKDRQTHKVNPTKIKNKPLPRNLNLKLSNAIKLSSSSTNRPSTNFPPSASSSKKNSPPKTKPSRDSKKSPIDSCTNHRHHPIMTATGRLTATDSPKTSITSPIKSRFSQPCSISPSSKRNHSEDNSSTPKTYAHTSNNKTVIKIIPNPQTMIKKLPT